MTEKTKPLSPLKNHWRDEDVAEASNVLQLGGVDDVEERDGDGGWATLVVLPLFSPDEPPTG